MINKFQMQFSVSNALNKWLKADLPRLPNKEGQRVGVHSLTSDEQTFCWQLNIIDNGPAVYRERARHKTIIACEANSRFIVFIPVDTKLTLDELAARLQMQWQYSLAETLQQLRAIPSSDIAMLLSELAELHMDTHWVKNTDLSISGHISDAALWVSQALAEQGLNELPSDLCTDLAIHLNTQKKRANNQTQKFMPIVKMMDYCQGILLEPQSLPAKPDLASATNTAAESAAAESAAAESAAANSTLVGGNIVQLSDYRK
ncbi:amino acid adenylation [Shewanella sp. SR44-3]|uniref:amino acid adenylation n=1 Tax=Shewanella sp. SR44-3 TaxID=2760936 RepID=UPI0015FC06A3|nr:amino acid adenylation [Shewanella sp. SR44-3]MBB1267907.1 amino acid adenylation [Shewanella sp. SR44-3]